MFLTRSSLNTGSHIHAKRLKKPHCFTHIHWGQPTRNNYWHHQTHRLHGPLGGFPIERRPSSAGRPIGSRIQQDGEDTFTGGALRNQEVAIF